MDIGLNWNEWHQEAARKPYVRVGVTLLSGALILMSAQEIVSLYLEKNLISEIEVCATTEDINVSGNNLPEKVTITKQIKEPEKMDEHSFLSAETIRTDVNQADVIQVAAVPAAWTGTFQVPESVKSFAESAFDGTNLECIDARSCTLEQTGSIPETVKLLE